MPIFFVTTSDIHGETITISDPLFTHLRASLRMQVGEQLLVGDGRGGRYQVQIDDISRGALTARILQEQREMPRQISPLILGQAMLKGDRMDWAIQKSTELATHSIIPLITQHAVVKLQKQRMSGQHARWQRIALEAAQQSEQWAIPSIGEPQDAYEFFARRQPEAVKLILTERKAEAQGLGTLSLPRNPACSVIITVGPEGGWSSKEVERALECGFRPVSLGAKILRAETAALAAVSILQSRLGALA
ncbi:MAG: 16S rRNA (uracil(1498)-N(3))-methyltransferase [Nitrospiraceae bacterium]